MTVEYGHLNQDQFDDGELPNETDTHKKCNNCVPCTFKMLYTFNLHSASYSNLYLLYKYTLTLACTQVYCERSFSKLKIIKTRLRSSLSQQNLNDLLLISIENDLIPKVSDVVELMLSKK